MRIRITFTKTGPLRYCSHLDLHGLWERAARRAGLPLLYSQGFHPLPRLQLAAALPLGFSGRAEIVDLWLDDSCRADLLTPAHLQSALPGGLIMRKADRVDESSPPLQTLMQAAEYEVTLAGPPATDIHQGIRRIMDAVSLPRLRRGRPYDLRPLIESLQMIRKRKTDPLILRMRLAQREGAAGRPDEVLQELGLPTEEARIERSALIFREKPIE